MKRDIYEILSGAVLVGVVMGFWFFSLGWCLEKAIKIDYFPLSLGIGVGLVGFHAVIMAGIIYLVQRHG